jgi:hypothetical protein
VKGDQHGAKEFEKFTEFKEFENEICESRPVAVRRLPIRVN